VASIDFQNSSGGYMIFIQPKAKEQSIPCLDLSGLQITRIQFQQLCEDNPDLKLELSREGKLIVMAPTFSISGERNSNLNGQLWVWNDRTNLGKVFDSNTGYDFAAVGGGILAPDASWISNDRISGIDLNQFCPISPDFVIELRSSTDRLATLQEKMLEYREYGVKLGWLINPQDRNVEVYRIGKEVEILESPNSVSGEDILPGFVLNLAKIW
jgi:Uma2 family endonuclease